MTWRYTLRWVNTSCDVLNMNRELIYFL